MPLGRLWGEFLTGDQKKPAITKHKAKHYMWAISDPSDVFSFMLEERSGSTHIAHQSGKPTTLLAFMRYLEDRDIVSFKIECHDLTEEQCTEQDGTKTTTWKIACNDSCLWLAIAEISA